MVDKYENAQKKLDELIAIYESKNIVTRNEATTRLHFINTLLLEVFCWDTLDITCEDSQDSEYSDYTLRIIRPVAIVEAKKQGDYFEIPIGIKSDVITLKTLLKGNKNLEKAVLQVAGYCQKRGIQIGIVSNGWQMVAYIANRTDSTPPIEGNAVFFKSLKDLKDNFLNYWNVFSKPAFENKNIFKKLMGDVLPELPPKLSVSIQGYPGIKNRNSFQSELQIISELVLEDVIKDESVEKAFLKECYCKSGALSSYSLVTKDILITRYKYLFDENDQKALLSQITTKRGLSQDLLDILAGSLSKRPILLVGDVGVGKTTFINNLLKVEVPEEIQHSMSFTVDLGSKAIFALDIKKAILNEIKRLLKENNKIDIEDDGFVRNCYFLELEDFKKSVKVKSLYAIDPNGAIRKEIEFLTDKVESEIQHLKKSLEFLCKSQRKQIIIFIDNCDQRSDSDQEEAFLIAHEFASSWPALVFVSLRPETFHRTKKSTGALSGYHTKAFIISPPRVDEVLQKRISFAQKITSGEISLSVLQNSTTFSNLHHLLESFKGSLSRNSSLIQCIDNISNGNIRKAVELLKSFFGSGHVNTEKILRIQNEQGYYTVSLHEFLRSVIFGDNVHYSPNSSAISNLLDVHSKDAKEHFIIPLLLGVLHNYMTISKEHGFIKMNEIYSLLQAYSFLSDQIDSAIDFCYSRGLIETSEKGNEILATDTSLMLRITPQGVYHVCNLINQFAYLDAIVVDTPIFSDDYRGKITDCYDVKDRLQRCDYFIEYLDGEWDKLRLERPHFNWMQRSNEVKQELQKIKNRIDLNARE